jgi:LuxR family transcriptional regulator, maltose regulon positive regulatory protein
MTADRPAPLLTVKQTIPPARAGLVARERLLGSLRAATTPLTVVVAPAGWGKTSLLGAWAADPGADVRVAWVSLDGGDDEQVRFWRYVLSALMRASEEVGSSAHDALDAQGAEPVDLALPVLLNELAASSTRHVIVLDDYHVLTDPRIHEAVEFLVTYLPASLRLVLACRADPPLPLARWRARGQLTELRAADLRFSVAEATALLASVAGELPDDGAATAAWERTEGWAAGLHLAGLAMRAHGPRVVRADDRHLLDYFTAEVLPALAPDQRDLLVRAAPLERLCGPLCDAALEVSGSAAVLDALERADLFVVPLDAERTWFRCHALLRDALRGGSAADAQDVLRRAAAWFAEHDRIDDAVAHLLRAGDTAAAAALLESAERWFFARGAAAGYLVLGEQLPRSQVTPQLALVMAYAAATSGRLDRVTSWLDTCDAHIGPGTVIRDWHSATAAATMLRAVVGTPDSDTARAVELCRQVVALETAAGGAGHPIAAAALGSALARDGQFEEAAAVLLEVWPRRDHVAWSPGVPLQLAGNLGLSLLELGRDTDRFLREAGALADRAERDWARPRARWWPCCARCRGAGATCRVTPRAHGRCSPGRCSSPGPRGCRPRRCWPWSCSPTPSSGAATAPPPAPRWCAPARPSTANR